MTQTLADILTETVIQVDSTATVAQAARAMRAAGVGSVVVRHGRELVGIFTERDLVRAAAAGVDAARSLVRAWMTTDIYSLPSTTPVAEAMGQLRARRHRRLPVVDDGVLVGMVSLSDFVRGGVASVPAGA